MSSKFDSTLTALMINHCLNLHLNVMTLVISSFPVYKSAYMSNDDLAFVHNQPTQEIISGCFAPLNRVYMPECTIRILVLFNHISSIEVAVDYACMVA